MKEREKCKKNEPSLTSIRQMVLEISHSKGRNLSKMEVAILKVLASFSHKYDVTDAILQENEKCKCNISGFFCLICLKLSGLLELSKRISLDFKFSCFGIYNNNNKPLFKNKRLLFSHDKKSVSSFFFKK